MRRTRSAVSADIGELIEATEGQFEFEKTQTKYQARIEAGSNTSLILDVLRDKDEARHDAAVSADEFMVGE